MTTWVRGAAVALLLAGTVPALAQDGGGMRGPRAEMFAAMSETGRATMLAAMRGMDMKTSAVEVKAARDRMLAVLDAERLDPAALRHAMEDEQRAVNAQRDKRQTAMLTAFQQLSLADRRAFVADARQLRERVENRNARMQQRRIGAAIGLMPPPK